MQSLVERHDAATAPVFEAANKAVAQKQERVREARRRLAEKKQKPGETVAAVQEEQERLDKAQVALQELLNGPVSESFKTAVDFLVGAVKSTQDACADLADQAASVGTEAQKAAKDGTLAVDRSALEQRLAQIDQSIKREEEKFIQSQELDLAQLGASSDELLQMQKEFEA